MTFTFRCLALRVAGLTLGLLLPMMSAEAARLALVIGNDQYQHASSLKNAGNDAQLMARTLRQAGFEVVGDVRLNLTGKAMWRAIDQFRARVAKGDEVVFYYAGHGVQIGGNPVLLPVDIEAESDDQVEREGVKLYELQDKFQAARFTLLVIDACRDNPFAPRPGRTRSIGDTRGLVPPADIVAGTAIIMAASRGQKALDSVPGVTTGNGLFTHELVQAIKTPGLDMFSALRKVRDEVEDKARRANPPHTQRPALLDETRGSFVLFPANERVATITPEPVVAPAQRPEPAPSVVSAAPKPGTVIKDCDVCPELVVLPQGSFVMGSYSDVLRDKNEGPQRTVMIGYTLAVGRYEVTQGEWKAVMGQNPSRFSSCGDHCPVERVSWNDTQEYIEKLNAKSGQKYRLLSEAEWEYSARAGTTTEFHTGNTITTSQANFNGDVAYNGSAIGVARGKTVKVGSFGANGFGLHDMHGNVEEWVEDVLHDNYSGGPTDGKAWMTGEDSSRRVLRGGSWLNSPAFVRSAFRGRPTQVIKLGTIGFRIARTF